MVPNYKGKYDLSDQMLREWAVLDCFNMLSPSCENPQTIEDVVQWFRDAKLVDVDVQYGYNGIEGRGTKPH